MSDAVAIIGGSGVHAEDLLTNHSPLETTSRYGPPSGPLAQGELAGRRVLFLNRHGPGHAIPPHRINYRANIAALRDAGATAVFAFAAVGGISPAAATGAIVIPDQIIDYTYGRDTTFYDGPDTGVHYIDFTEPYSASLRDALLSAGRELRIELIAAGTYAATQGPRLESRAEIARLARDGCDIVGMTGMPEAALAREAGLEYATMAIVGNRAAGLGDEEITFDDVVAVLRAGQTRALEVLRKALLLLDR